MRRISSTTYVCPRRCPLATTTTTQHQPSLTLQPPAYPRQAIEVNIGATEATILVNDWRNEHGELPPERAPVCVGTEQLRLGGLPHGTRAATALPPLHLDGMVWWDEHHEKTRLGHASKHVTTVSRNPTTGKVSRPQRLRPFCRGSVVCLRGGRPASVWDGHASRGAEEHGARLEGGAYERAGSG